MSVRSQRRHPAAWRALQEALRERRAISKPPSSSSSTLSRPAERRAIVASSSAL
jgi:hypothetical protein